MNALLQELRDPQRQRFEADLAARVATLFRRCSVLCGFTVQEDEPSPSYFACYPALDPEEADAILAEIARMLDELVDEEPQAAELLLGRTFARIVH